ncbi:MAG: hypothetical protein ACRDQ7_28090 [Haloechinothrix sp.]
MSLALTEGLLLAHEGRAGEPRNLPASFARARGLAPPRDVEPEDAGGQSTLFDARGSGLPAGVRAAEAAEVVLAEQQRRLDRLAAADGLRLLVAAESASALAADVPPPTTVAVRGVSGVAHRAIRPPGGTGPSPHAGRTRRAGHNGVRWSGGQSIPITHPVWFAPSRAGIDVPSSRA